MAAGHDGSACLSIRMRCPVSWLTYIKPTLWLKGEGTGNCRNSVMKGWLINDMFLVKVSK
ncbi:hypothetical protein NNRS527_01555 [Nitrosospira sp. NRS527]|nr:hypothetical protein NNRS527_01555 [Nitrosospira sp. NRS527]